MDINVRTNVRYKEVQIRYGSASIETGLLDEDEAREMALVFLRAAENLLPDSVERDKLIEIQGVL